LFDSHGFPGDAPAGNKVEKSRLWLRQGNKQLPDALSNFGQLIAEMMDSEWKPTTTADWNTQETTTAPDPRDRIVAALAKEGLSYVRGGYIHGASLTGPTKSLGERLKTNSKLARSEYVTRRENIIAVGNSGTGKTHIGLGLGLAACQKGLSVGFYTAAALVHELLEARDEKRLLRLQRQLSGYKLLIIDELGYVPLSQTGAELLFEVFSQRYERGSTVVTSNLPFDEWTSVFSSERLTGALLDRLTHHVHILEMNGDSYRLNQSKRRSRRASSDSPADNSTQA